MEQWTERRVVCQRSWGKGAGAQAQANHTSLEFDAVVVVAPGAFFGPAEETVNQRKLLYVALTRAKRAAQLIRVG